MLEEEEQSRSRWSPEPDDPFGDVSLEKTISPRWALRDIKARRLKLTPVSPADLQLLIDLGLVEMRGDAPVLIDAGYVVLD
jgi:hypothetical protein